MDETLPMRADCDALTRAPCDAQIGVRGTASRRTSLRTHSGWYESSKWACVDFACASIQ